MDLSKRLLRTPNSTSLIAVVLLCLSLGIGFTYIFNLIHPALAPYTIVDLEMARTPEALTTMTAHWGEAGNAAARLSLYVDFFFMPIYVGLFSGLALLTARATPGRWQTPGLWLALAPLGAWIFDILENLMLLRVLPPAAPEATALFTADLAAWIKFGLLIVTGVYVLLLGGRALFYWIRRA